MAQMESSIVDELLWNRHVQSIARLRQLLYIQNVQEYYVQQYHKVFHLSFALIGLPKQIKVLQRLKTWPKIHHVLEEFIDLISHILFSSTVFILYFVALLDRTSVKDDEGWGYNVVHELQPYPRSNCGALDQGSHKNCKSRESTYKHSSVTT